MSLLTWLPPAGAVLAVKSYFVSSCSQILSRFDFDEITSWGRLFQMSTILLVINIIDYSLFYVPLKNISLIWRRHQYRWRDAKFRPMLGAQGPWTGRDLYRATPSVTRDLSSSGLTRRTAPVSRLLRHRIYSNPDPHGSPISRLLRHTRGCGGPIHLTWFIFVAIITALKQTSGCQLFCMCSYKVALYSCRRKRVRRYLFTNEQ
jgi:hypothetical protein